MAFSVDTHWIWDFWVADDGERFHLFYLYAPKSLGDPDLRHRNARIGHASSGDLTNWIDHGEVLAPGKPGSFDETATWTGCAIRDDAGGWRMFYTGASFNSADSPENIETIGCAVSDDLHTWTKDPDVLVRADPAHYETLGDTSWPEEAWRDPWVFRDPAGDGWRMLITARGKSASATSGGVIGHAWSADLVSWSVRPSLGKASREFAHLEVLQLVESGGKQFIVFSAPRNDSLGGVTSGIWAVEVPDGGLDEVVVDDARLIAGDPYYAGRVVHDRNGTLMLLSFIGGPGSTQELNGISDPVPVAL